MATRLLPNHDKKTTINIQTGSSKTKNKNKNKKKHKKFKNVKHENVLISEKCFNVYIHFILKWLQDYCPIMIRKPL